MIIIIIFFFDCQMPRPIARPPVGQFGWNFRSWTGECMTMDDSNFIGMQRGVQEQWWKSAGKLWFSLFFAFDCQALLPIVWPPVGQFGWYFRRCMGVWIHDYSWFKLIARTQEWGNIRGRSPLIFSHKWPQATCSLVYLFQVNSPFYFISARVAGYAGACPQHI